MKEWFNKDGRPLNNVIVKDILNHFGRDKMLADGKYIYMWENDHYAFYGENLIAKYIQESAQGISSRVVNDIVNGIRNLTYKTPSEFRAMRLPLDFIPVKNGLLNWKTGELLAHNPSYFYPKRLDVEYKREAIPRGFIKYSLSRFENNYKEMFKMWEDLALIHFRDNRYQIVSIWMGESIDSSGLVSGEEGKTTTAEKIIGDRYLGRELYSRAGLQSFAKSEFEFYNLKDRWLHVASMDETGNIANYAGLIEQLRDPFMEKPVKNNPAQQFWENTAYNILIGNKFPKATASTKAFYRSVRKIVHWRKQMGEDWRYVEKIDEEEKSGILNLSVAFMQAIELRGKPYGLMSLEDTTREYHKISDPLSMLLTEIFERDAESKMKTSEVFKLVSEESEARGLVMEDLTRTRLTRSLKELFGVVVSRTTTKKVVNKDGDKVKNTIHEDSYQGIRVRDKYITNLDTEMESDTLVDAVIDYLASFENGDRIRVSEFPLTPFFRNILLNYKEGDISKLDTRISSLLSYLENANNTLSEVVSNFANVSNFLDTSSARTPTLQNIANEIREYLQNLGGSASIALIYDFISVHYGINGNKTHYIMMQLADGDFGINIDYVRQLVSIRHSDGGE